MAIEIQINPLDFEPDVAIGIDLPMIGSNGTFFKKTYTTIDQAYANAKNLLLTNSGERIMQPEFGANIRAFLFQNMTEDALDVLKSNIESAFSRWLPYVGISKLETIPNDSRNTVFINMEIYLIGNDLDRRSLQLTVINGQ